MARTTIEDVKVIIDTSLTDDQITTFLTTANLLVTSLLGGTTLDDTALEEIEKYICAHVLSNRDPRVTSVGVDVLSESYQGSFGMGLNATSYGQTAILLDSSGTLGRMAKKGFKGAASISMMEYHSDESS